MIMNEKNLKPNSERTPSDRQEQARRAGVASGIARRRKKLFKDIASQVLNGDVINPDAQQWLKEAGIEDPTVYEEVLYTLVKKALKGDVKAIRTLVEINDGQSLQSIDITSDGQPLFRGFPSVLPDVKDIADVLKKLDEEREKKLLDNNN